MTCNEAKRFNGHWAKLDSTQKSDVVAELIDIVRGEYGGWSSSAEALNALSDFYNLGLQPLPVGDSSVKG